MEAKPVYRITLRSVDGADFNTAIRFHPAFENQAMLPSDAAYQVAVESFVIANVDPNQFNVPVFITAWYLRGRPCGLAVTVPASASRALRA